jgi:hypothetical protein
VSLRDKAQRALLRSCVAVSVILLNACSSDILLANWVCKPSGSVDHPDSGSSDAGTEFSPWGTSFENGFCDYSSEGNGSCYTSHGAATFGIVEAPVHVGHYAAAFTVVGDGSNTDSGTNSRCHRDGELPSEAYYGAWFYVPTLATNSGNWNLIHFQGRNTTTEKETWRGEWDVSLVNNANGGLRLTVRDYVEGSSIPEVNDSPPIPIGTWFHLVVFLKVASDPTGEFAVYQDGTKIMKATNLITHSFVYGQWYVGNVATNLNPSRSTLYVDDVSVGSEL